jgi:hypothetical protein
MVVKQRLSLPIAFSLDNDAGKAKDVGATI